MKILETLINKLESKISKQEFKNPVISTSPIGWHIEHSLLVISIVIEQLKKSNPLYYKRKFNFNRLLVFTINNIPRRSAKAPFIVIPKFFDSITLQSHCLNIKIKLKYLEQLNQAQYFYHPYLGNLRLNEAIRFLEIHTNHHIKIIDDIISKTK